MFENMVSKYGLPAIILLFVLAFVYFVGWLSGNSKYDGPPSGTLIIDAMDDDKPADIYLELYETVEELKKKNNDRAYLRVCLFEKKDAE